MGEKMLRSGGLSPKQERFCQEYAKDLNGTRAAIRAGYAERSAAEQAARLLTIDKVFSRVSELKAEQTKRLGLDADLILREMLAIARADVTEAFDDMGGLRPFREWPPELRKALSGLEVAELFDGRGDEKTAIGLLKKVRFWDKNKALEGLAKHLRLLTERHEHSGPDGKPIEYQSHLSDEQIEARIAQLQAAKTPAAKEEG